jgi:ribosomal protein S27AE
MIEVSIEKRLKQLEIKISEMEDKIKKLPWCPKCKEFLLMADESTGHHFQCYSCGSWWDVPKSLASFKVKPGFKGALPRDVIPNRRK